MDKERANKTFFLPRKVEFLLRLSLLKEKTISITDFEKMLGFKNPQPDVRLVFKLLIDEGIITYSDTIYNIDLYKIDFKKLVDYIDELRFMEELIHRFYQEHHWVSY